MSGSIRGRKKRGVEIGERPLGLVEASDQEEAPGFEGPCMRGVEPVAMRFECRASRIERLHWPTQIARGERDFGLGDQAPRASYSLSRTEGASGTSQESLGPDQIAQLRHRSAAKRQCGRVVAQGDPF